MLGLDVVVDASREIAASRSRKEKHRVLVDVLRRARPESIVGACVLLSGGDELGRVGVGYRTVFDTNAAPADVSSLSVADVMRAIENIAGVSGKGANKARADALSRLLGTATAPEQEFLKKLLVGELRQGGLEDTLVLALTDVYEVALAKLRSALMLGGSLRLVVESLEARGPEALGEFRLQHFRAVRPMLASPCESIEAAFAVAGSEPASLRAEWKLDGVRVQVHKLADEVRVYSRNLNDVTEQLPDVRALALSLPARSCVLDGEALLVGANGRAAPFQESMARFATRVGADAASAENPLRVYFFDCLEHDGETLIGAPLSERLTHLVECVPDERRVPSLTTADSAEMDAFVQESMAVGHEGAVIKSLTSLYEAGKRGDAWLKIKRLHTADLVVLAAEWGSGRRKGWLSNLHLGARSEEREVLRHLDRENGQSAGYPEELRCLDKQHGKSAGYPEGFVMLGKTFKGLTDAMLEHQTRVLLEHESSRYGHVVYVRPCMVLEIAYMELQDSSRYPAGVALRLARVKRVRNDKRVEDATTLQEMLAVR